MRLKYAAVLLIACLCLSCSRTSDVVEVQFWNFGGRPKFLELDPKASTSLQNALTRIQSRAERKELES